MPGSLSSAAAHGASHRILKRGCQGLVDPCGMDEVDEVPMGYPWSIHGVSMEYPGRQWIDPLLERPVEIISLKTMGRDLRYKMWAGNLNLCFQRSAKDTDSFAKDCNTWNSKSLMLLRWITCVCPVTNSASVECWTFPRWSNMCWFVFLRLIRVSRLESVESSPLIYPGYLKDSWKL